MWDSEYLKNAWNSLTPEQQQKYQMAGSNMYDTIDYEKIGNQEEENAANKNYLQQLLKYIAAKQLEYKDLNEDDLKLLATIYPTQSEIEKLFQ